MSTPDRLGEMEDTLWRGSGFTQEQAGWLIEEVKRLRKDLHEAGRILHERAGGSAPGDQ